MEPCLTKENVEEWLRKELFPYSYVSLAWRIRFSVQSQSKVKVSYRSSTNYQEQNFDLHDPDLVDQIKKWLGQEYQETDKFNQNMLFWDRRLRDLNCLTGVCISFHLMICDLARVLIL